MTDVKTDRVNRSAVLEWVPIADMRVNKVAQREYKQHRVDHLVAHFSLEQMGTPTVNSRDGLYYLIDGQHRIRALEAMGYGDQQVQCWVYTGLTEAQEADMFLLLNNALSVDALSKFRAAITAEWAEESAVNRIVQGAGLRVGNLRQPRTIMAVATLLRVYRQGGPDVLRRTLRIAYESFGDGGLESAVISGIGLVCQRFNGQVDDDVAIEQLSSVRNGVTGLMQQVTVLHAQTGRQRVQCVAATVAATYNKGRRSARLPSWWKAGPDGEGR